MFGRESLSEVIRSEGERTQALIDNLHEESLRALEETREFNREILLRNEKVYTAAIAELERMGRQIEEGRLQIRANTEAVLRLLGKS